MKLTENLAMHTSLFHFIEILFGCSIKFVRPEGSQEYDNHKSYFWFTYRCDQLNCRALVRPHVVWFGEGLNRGVLNAVDQALDKCDMCLLVRLSFIYNE